MATNKNQHFVPRCYLRAFTVDAKNTAINLFNLDRKKLIPNAPVKNQCSRDYFYGKDDKLESAIQLVETNYAKAVRELIANNGSLTKDSIAIFKIFWIFQNLRTEAAAMRAVQIAEDTKNTAGITAEDFSLGIKEAVQMACLTFSQSMHVIDDLKFCIIKNKTKLPFITSDNPAILTNRWKLDKDKLDGHSFGMGSSGVLILLPITPKIFFLGYDGDVYNVQNKKGIVEVKNIRDVIALNRHQFLQCAANVYIHDSIHGKSIIESYSTIESDRPKVRHIIHYAQIDSTVDGYTRYVVTPPEERDHSKDAILHSQVIHPHPGMWPSQICIRKNGSVFTDGTGVGYIRRSRLSIASTGNFRRERP